MAIMVVLGPITIVLAALVLLGWIGQPVRKHQYRNLTRVKGLVVETSDSNPTGKGRGVYVRIRTPGDRHGRLLYVAEFRLYRRLSVGQTVEVLIGDHPRAPGRWIVEIAQRADS